MKLDAFARYPFLFGPSPVHPLERLSAHLGGARIWAKRDDCNSGLAFGGNKIRKLEYLVADAIAQGCDTLVSIGGVQSNHTRQVAAAAARVWMRCVLIQESWVDWPDAVYDRVGNILLSRILGADVRLVQAGVRDRVQGELGAGARGDRGVRRAAVCDPGRRVGPPPGRPRLHAVEGMLTDPVYEGKSMAGLIDLVSRVEIEKRATVLDAHLGGQPALNAYSALFR